MPDHLEVTISNRPSERGRVLDLIESYCGEGRLGGKKVHELQLAIEEHLANICHHGYLDAHEHAITVRADWRANEVTVEIEDDGRPFNPLRHPSPDLTVPFDQRPLGGMGIHMMRQSVDSVLYRRAGEFNILTLVKRA